MAGSRFGPRLYGCVPTGLCLLYFFFGSFIHGGSFLALSLDVGLGWGRGGLGTYFFSPLGFQPCLRSAP